MKQAKKLTPRQAKLIKQIPAVVAGKKTKKQALLDAGYSEGSARQQQEALGSLRTNTAMQEALRKAGVTEDKLAHVIAGGLDAMKDRQPDHHARHKFVVTAAELRDDFPAKKIDIHDVTPIRYSEIESKPKTLEEARALAEEE